MAAINLTEAFVIESAVRRGKSGSGDTSQPVWRVIVDGTVVPATFMSKGAAEAAIPVERTRRAKRAAR